MKKKIMIVISLAVMLICLFAISISASNYIDFSNCNIEDNMSCSFNLYLNTDYNGDDFTSSSDETFGLIGFICDCDEPIYGFYNIEWWHSYLSQFDIDNSDDFANAVVHMAEIGLICASDDGIFYQGPSNSSFYYPVYQSYVAELEAPTYEDGYNQGLEDATFGSNALVNLINPLESAFNKPEYSADGYVFYNSFDGHYNLNGYSERTFSYRLYSKDNPICLESGNYLFSGGTESVRLCIYKIDDSGNYGSLLYTVRNDVVSFNITESGKYSMLLLADPNFNYDNLDIFPCIVKYEVDEYGTEYLYSQEEFDKNYNKGYLEYINGEEYKKILEDTETNAVTEYKKSDEYIGMYNSRYEEGYLYGVNNYKDSEAHKLLLDDTKELGRAEGVLDFKKSQEYANILSTKYDQGYDDGVADTSGEVIESKANAIFVSIFGVVLLVLVVVYLSKAKNKKRR